MADLKPFQGTRPGTVDAEALYFQVVNQARCHQVRLKVHEVLATLGKGNEALALDIVWVGGVLLVMVDDTVAAEGVAAGVQSDGVDHELRTYFTEEVAGELFIFSSELAPEALFRNLAGGLDGRYIFFVERGLIGKGTCWMGILGAALGLHSEGRNIMKGEKVMRLNFSCKR